MTVIFVCEWAGTIFGLLGALMLATNTRISRYGWIAFLVANIAMIAFAANINAQGLLVQQLGFMGTSCLGIYRARLWSGMTFKKLFAVER